MRIGDTSYYSGNVNTVLVCTYAMIWIQRDDGRRRRLLQWQCKEGPGLYLHNGLLVDVMKTQMRTRPAPIMKNGWLCRNFR